MTDWLVPPVLFPDFLIASIFGNAILRMPLQTTAASRPRRDLP